MIRMRCRSVRRGNGRKTRRRDYGGREDGKTWTTEDGRTRGRVRWSTSNASYGRPGKLSRLRLFDLCQIRAHHRFDRVLERCARFPPKLASCLRCVGDQRRRINRPEKCGVRDDVSAIIEIHGRERDLAQLPHGVRRAGTDHEIVRGSVTHDTPERVDIVPRESPVASRLEVAKPQLALTP